ncbi:hypothetical protein DIZ81_04395 [Legionella taurinensis]|uniref:Uncharacterized protein n=2 Tax=Legionella taurinensis TaxID=70611 RepID=A0A3A5LV15_9GAMM|nr:hypothetical protein DB744_04395 [Legionella taurinensis]PUT42558.1 hypothetical protein DB746_06730 [Legionella taurinensis]PUT46586.1 hypothetical protein DB743_04130 [Legionella taurinensis]PUT47236.1 hypothetical protein DB745_07810 [Legionella taurinensis]RJT48323.1 hypothetical protein D6J04_04280 [Legionella taurinensis]
MEHLLNDFGQPGDIPVEAMALSLHIKRLERQQKGSDLHAFAMLASEIEELDQALIAIIDSNACDFRFQVTVGNKGSVLTHWSFMEFVFRANPEGRPELDVFICDPLGMKQSVVLALLLSNTIRFGGLADFCKLTVYIPATVLQIAGRTCPYLALDSIAMLSNQSNFEDLYQYMREHENGVNASECRNLIELYKTGIIGCMDEEQIREMYDFPCVVSALPPRLVRTSQSLPVIDDVANHAGDEVVNAKGKTFRLSTSRYRLIVEDRYGEKEERNLRINFKMKEQNSRLRAYLANVSEQSDTQPQVEAGSPTSAQPPQSSVGGVDDQLAACIDAQRMSGLNQWVNETLAIEAMSTLKFS